MNNERDDFLHDYVTLLLEKRAQIKAEGAGVDFEKGRLFGLYEALSLLSDQLMAFEIDPSDIGLESFDPDQILLDD